MTYATEHKEKTALDSPEFRLLRMAARIEADQDTLDRIRMQSRVPLDWEKILRLARSHGVVPLIYGILRNLSNMTMPAKILEQLHDDYQKNAQRNLRLTSELIRLLDRFEASGVQVAPVKGPVLAEMVYGNIALRTFGDLDLFIRRCDYPAGLRILVEEGYCPAYQLSKTHQDLFLSSSDEMPFQKEAQALRVDLRWAIFPKHDRLPFSEEAWFDHPSTITLAGRDIQTFSLEKVFLHSCIHGSKHIWYKLKWLCDVAEIIRMNSDLNWSAIVDLAAGTGMERSLQVGLHLANDLLEVPLPAAAEEFRLKCPNLTRLSGPVYSRLKEPSSVPGFWTGHFYQVALSAGLSGKIRLIMRLLTTHNLSDWNFLPLPKWLFPLYIPLRIMRISIRELVRLCVPKHR